MTTTTVFAKTSDKHIDSDSSTSQDRAREGLDTLVVGGSGASNIRYGQTNPANSNNTQTCYEQFEQFDTSSITALEAVDSVTFSMVPSSVAHLSGTSWTVEVRLVDWGTAVETTDFEKGSTLGDLTFLASRSSTGLSDDVRYDITEKVPAFRDNIALDGDTRLFLHSSRHRLDQAEGPNVENYIINYSADETGTTKDPKLIITHTTIPTIALTGTITNDSEVDIRVGGSTIILTISAATWAASGSTFNAERQGIINGFDSGGTDPNGWDAVAVSAIGVGDVVRTSNTIVTITMPEIQPYNVQANETVTATVPASAHSGADAIVASPTFTITVVTAGIAKRSFLVWLF